MKPKPEATRESPNMIVESLPANCNAVVLEKFNQPMQVQSVKMPESIEPGAILVKIEVASICGTDVHLYEGDLSAVIKSHLPIIPGHEMVGRVVALGEGVTRDSTGEELKIGDRILWEHAACGACHYCQVLKEPTLCKNRTIYGMQECCNDSPYLLGGFSEYCYVVPKSGRVKIPDEVKSEWASSIGCALRTVMKGFERLAHVGDVDFTDTVLVQGSGPLGLFAIAVASAKSPKEIIVVGGPENRLNVARSWGATKVVSVEELPNAESRVNRVMEMTNGMGADVILEMSGAHGAFAEGIEMIAVNGRYVIVGPTGGPKTPIPVELITKKNIDIVGSWSAGIEHYYKGLQFVKQHRDKINFDLLFTNRYTFKDINKAIQNMKSAEDIKPLLFPN